MAAIIGRRTSTVGVEPGVTRHAVHYPGGSHIARTALPWLTPSPGNDKANWTDSVRHRRVSVRPGPGTPGGESVWPGL